jgi:hypothetical protein
MFPSLYFARYHPDPTYMHLLYCTYTETKLYVGVVYLRRRQVNANGQFDFVAIFVARLSASSFTACKVLMSDHVLQGAILGKIYDTEVL